MKVTEITNGKVRCVGYKTREKYFTLGKVYEVKDDTIKNENGFTYRGSFAGENVIKYLSGWYEFEAVSCEKIVITTDGKTTTATKYCEDGKKVTTTARCAPEDEFDFNVGAKLAMERLMNIVAPVTYGGFKVGDRVNHNGINGTVICIAKERYGENDNAIGVEFDEANGMHHNCGGVELAAGTEGTKGTSRWMKPSWLVHGEVIKPKYYNGKIVCVDNIHNKYTVGKIYDVVDGKFTNDESSTISHYGTAFKTFDEIVEFSSAKWLEIKE